MDHTVMMAALQKENEKFQECSIWMEKAMPHQLFQDLDLSTLMLVIHNLLELDSQGYSSTIQVKNSAIALCMDDPDADLKILKNYSSHGIRSYQAYVSTTPPTFIHTSSNIRIVIIHFFSSESDEEPQKALPSEEKSKLRKLVAKENPMISDEDFEVALRGIGIPFLLYVPLEKIAIAIAMYYRATTRDHCQYEVRYNEDWESNDQPSMQLIVAWRNVPKHNFLYRLVRAINRNGLVIKNISASYNNPYTINSILLVAFELHGDDNKAAWETTDLPEFLKEFITIKYFASFDSIDHYLVQPGIISGNMGNLLRAMLTFIHQSLVHLDVYLYSLEHVEEGLCRHPELTGLLCDAFNYRFNPEALNESYYEQTRDNFLKQINKLDTGHEEHDIRRKNILTQGMNFIQHTLKTNFYRPNYTSLSFRLDPKYLDDIPFDRAKKFPELPYAIFFVKGMHFFGFHIRFRDLARGGLRTVFPDNLERLVIERNTAFTECYNLAFTQQMKNKDIPEGGAKGIILLKPYDRLDSETAILRRELQNSELPDSEIDLQIEQFKQEQRSEHLYQSQRAFIESLLTLVNCDAEGKLRARSVVDYFGKPEYLYVGPDENMHDSMIQWIANYSRKCHYKPGSAFISGKSFLGINHKEYGVTSLGVNVYMEAVLRYLGIDPTNRPFTVKMAGGPDGDVAGNQICNLQRFYKKGMAKLIALTDVSGTIYDPNGLDLDILVEMFHRVQGIRFYPPSKLGEDGFLVDKMTKHFQTSLVQQTLCWRKKEGKLIQDWLSGSDTNFLLRNNVHQTPADIFIPAGGRPRTLNESNYKEFLDSSGKPTARAIIEGANLYLNNNARNIFENLGVLIIKDSSANKTGVICSSFEVLSGLTLGDEKFIENKPELIVQIKERLAKCAAQEANLLLRTNQMTGEHLTDISDKISKRINLFKDQILDYLNTIKLSDDPKDPLIQSFLNYCLPLLKHHYPNELLEEIPESHKKAIIACHIGAQLVYDRGLSWFPTIVDILPVLLSKNNKK